MSKPETEWNPRDDIIFAVDATPETAQIARNFDMEQALFGGDTTARLVAVETQDRTATLFRVDDDGSITQEVVPFLPWVVLRGERRDLPDVASCETLVGDNYNLLIRFNGWRASLEGRRILREERRDFVAYGAATKQFLISSGRTLFKGMAFSDIRRMQIDIETSGLSFNEKGACIFMIVASDNRGHEDVLLGDEREMLEKLTRLVQDWDPDVIEGHNIYGFDLPWIRARAKAHGVTLAWGRANEANKGERAEVTVGQERNCAIGANTRPFVGHYVWGRHIVDTLFQTQRFDIAKGEISSYNLKECAVAYHIAEPNRVYLDRSQILATYERDPDLVRAYALGDVRETRRLAEVVCPTEFFQTQMVPDSYQSVTVTGSGEKINSIFVRAYLQRGHAIARQQGSASYGGGYTEMRLSGVLHRIVKADVESLYPSIMLTQNISSASDTLGIFLPMLRELTRRRLKAKGEARRADIGRAAAYWDGLQNSYKLLINSFYGYLGAPFYFNDFNAAGQVTQIGQGIVKNIAAMLEAAGSKVVEIDTDGVYFQPPDGVDGAVAEEAFVGQIGTGLADGIRLAFDGRYAVMLSLKAKNYVLVGYDGKKIFKGSSLRSRADERFGRTFLGNAVDLLLNDDLPGLTRLYRDLQEKIASRALGIEEIARRERVTDKTFHSEAKARSAKVMVGLKVGEYAVLYQREDKSLVLASEYNNDEDIEHYENKLYKFAQRLQAAIGDDFDRLFPKPLSGARRKAKEDSKHQMNLFDL